MPSSTAPQPTAHLAGVAIVGGGPAGLMAAEVLADAAVPVDLYDSMPSVGRKFLLAGKGGLNLTHAEAFERFIARYAERAPQLQPMLANFDADALRAWAAGLGISTFIGSSQRVFPAEMKAAPLLRAWLQRLRAKGVRLHMRHRWTGFIAEDRPGLRFETPRGDVQVRPRATVLALGGASWSRLGSDGRWAALLAQAGVDVAPLKPSNCGFEVAWTEHLRSRHAGQPLKNVAMNFTDPRGKTRRQTGEMVVTDYGVEGSLVYAFSAALRDAIEAGGQAIFHLDLLPSRSADWVAAELTHPRGSRSLATHLKSRLGLDGVKAALLYECLHRDQIADPLQLGGSIKALPITVLRPRPIDEAISSAGGVRFEAVDEHLMLQAIPGVFCAGEMLDWDAPTGGYLLAASFATGRAAGQGALRWLTRQAEHAGGAG